MFDWNIVTTILNDAVLELVKYLAPILLATLISYIGVRIKSEWITLKNKYPDIISEVECFAPILVSYIEQMRKIGILPDAKSIRAEIKKTLENYLRAKGFDADLTPYWDVFNSIIEAEVNRLPKFEIDISK